MLKRAGKILFIALASIGILATAAILYATSDPGARRISAAVRDAIRAQTDFVVSFESIDLGALPPRLTLRDIRAEDAKKRISCTIEEAELAPDIIELVRGDLVIEEVYLGTPRCRVRLDRETIDVLEAKKKASAQKSAAASPGHLDLSAVPRFEVFGLSDGRVEMTVEDRGGLGAVHAVVDGLNLDVTGDEDSIEVRGLVRSAAARIERGGAIVDERLDRLEFRVGLSEEGVDVRQVNAAIGGAELSARDAFIPVPLWPTGPRVDSVSISVQLEPLGRLPLGLPQLQGRVGFAGQASARKGAKGEPLLSARGRVSLRGGKVDDLVIGDVDGLVSLAPEGVSFSEVVVATAEGVVRAEGNVAFDGDRAIEATADFERVELGHLLANLTLTGAQVTQRMTGSARIRGTLAPLSLDVQSQIAVEDHRVWSSGFRDPRKEELLHLAKATIAGPLHVSERAITAKGLDVRFGATRVAVDLGFNFDMARGWHLEARSDRFDLGDVGAIAGLKVAGRGPISCRIVDAPYGDPRITGTGSFDGLAVQGVAFDRGETSVRFAFPVLAFEGLSLRGPHTTLSSRELAISFGGRAGLEVHGKIEVEKAAIEDLGRAFGIDLSPYGSPRGQLYGRAAIDYVARPENLRLEVAVDHDALEVVGERFGPGGLEFVYDRGDLTVGRFDAKKGGGAISLTGAVFADGAVDIMGIAREVPLSSIDYAPFRALGVGGLAQVFLNVGGTRASPEGAIDLRVDDAEHRGVRYGPSHVEIGIDGALLTGRGNLGGERVTLEHGELDLRSKRFALEAFAYRLDLVPLLGVDTKGQRAAVTVTGEVDLRGRIGAELGLTGRAAVDEVSVDVNDFRFENEGPVVLTADRDRFRLRRARFRGDRLVFDLSGRATVERVSLALHGIADLSALADLVGPVTSSSGRLVVDGTASGPWGDPRFYGRAAVQDGAAIVSGFPTPIEDVTGAITFGAKSIRFSDFSAKAADGRIDVDGQLDLDAFAVKDYRFRATLDRLFLQPSEEMSFTASSAKDGLFLRRGKRGLPLVTGDVEVSDFKYTRDLRMVQLSDLSLSRFTAPGASAPRVLEEKNDAFEYDVRLHGKRNLAVRNNLVDAALRIDDEEEPLRLVGTNQSYGLLGRVLGTRGQVRFQGQVFDLRYASLVFRDKLRPDNPYFRVTADGQVRDWRVSITAEGTVDDYKIKLTSQPYLSNEDLVFLLLTGMTKAERQQYGGSEIAPISDLVSNVGGEVIPVEVRIYSEYSEIAGKDTTRISLGKRVADDIWVAVTSSVGKEREIEANVEYKLNDNFSLFGDYDNESQAGNLGVDLRFRLEF
jgi:translocation and assembly module TamB